MCYNFYTLISLNSNLATYQGDNATLKQRRTTGAREGTNVRELLFCWRWLAKTISLNMSLAGACPAKLPQGNFAKPLI